MVFDDLDDDRSADELRFTAWPPQQDFRIMKKPNVLYQLTMDFSFVLSKLLYRSKIENKHFITRMHERQEGFIFTSNHDSGFDQFFFIQYLPCRIHVLMLDNPWLDNQIAAEYFHRNGIISVAVKGNSDSLDVAKKLLLTDHVVLLYPEANFVHHRRAIYGKTGIAVLAATTGKPVLPVAIQGIDYHHFLDFLPPLNYRVRSKVLPPRRVRDEYLIPVNAELSQEVRRGITDEIMYDIRMQSHFAGLKKEHAKELYHYYKSLEQNKYTMLDPDFT